MKSGASSTSTRRTKITSLTSRCGFRAAATPPLPRLPLPHKRHPAGTGQRRAARPPLHEEGPKHATDRSLLTVERIVEFADAVKIADVQPVLQRQIDCNTAIAKEGLRGQWGANIGRILLESYGDSTHNPGQGLGRRRVGRPDERLRTAGGHQLGQRQPGTDRLAAGHHLRRALGSTREELYRALVVSNLVTIHLKTGIGSLSAYCGATAAGCGAGAGVCYLHGGRYKEIAHTIVNAVAIDSGMICDGAKASCAAKIASAVEAGLLGWKMQQHHSQFYGGDGIVVKASRTPSATWAPWPAKACGRPTAPSSA